MIAKLKEFIKAHHSDVALTIVIVCISIISFNIGRMSARDKAVEPLSSGFSGSTAKSTARSLIIPSPTPQDPRVVASKASSSKAYHFMWCSGASRISEKNKIYFPTESAAKAAGYSLAGNCTK